MLHIIRVKRDIGLDVQMLNVANGTYEINTTRSHACWLLLGSWCLHANIWPLRKHLASVPTSSCSIACFEGPLNEPSARGTPESDLAVDDGPPLSIPSLAHFQSFTRRSSHFQTQPMLESPPQPRCTTVSIFIWMYMRIVSDSLLPCRQAASWQSLCWSWWECR